MLGERRGGGGMVLLRPWWFRPKEAVAALVSIAVLVAYCLAVWDSQLLTPDAWLSTHPIPPLTVITPAMAEPTHIFVPIDMIQEQHPEQQQQLEKKPDPVAEEDDTPLFRMEDTTLLSPVVNASAAVEEEVAVVTRGISDTSALLAPDAEFDYGAALLREAGFPHLLRTLELALEVEQRSRAGCVPMDNRTEHTLPSELCLTPELLTPVSKMTCFADFVRPPPLKMVNNPKLGFMYPFLSGSTFRVIADDVQECRSPFWWRKGGREYRRIQWDAHPAAWRNRSLVFWNLNPFKPRCRDLSLLRALLTNGTIRAHFFLVCTNGDNFAFPRWLLQHRLLLKLFSINVKAVQRHPKLVPIPLGIHPTHNKVAEELCLYRLKSFLLPSVEDNLLYARFRTTNHRGRRVLVDALNRSFPAAFPNVTLATRRVRRALFYGSILRHRFVLAPPGNGIDTYRVWEALYLGRVPVVDSSLHASLYDELPVVVLRSWADLTPQLLQARWAQLAAPERGYNLDRLKQWWWLIYLVRHCLATR